MKQKQIDRRTLLSGGLSLAAAASLCNSAHAEDRPKPIVPGLEPGPARLTPLELRLERPEGGTRSLSAWRGAPFVLHVWATWCGPCKIELPQLDAFMKKLGDDSPIVPVAMSSHGPDEVAAFLKNLNLTHIDPWTADWHEFRAWLGVSELSFPGSYLIDPEGRLRAAIEDETDWGAPDAVSQFRKVIAALKE
ncbi:thiol:disulfide interchange protein [Gluconobacter oxydans]|uniref:TlpA disulfide reductase family protein n=1 Tax=Gluconobacter thailandicus TaxID=257438 RepID=UPI00029994AA|nr:TlpA disulfide reductase family protein [Gluconobacter thailandicus]AFV99637.1 thiol:disulfide interchange protein I [Gluconobacter oxydans H24]ANQ41505.1 thiol:disulfide interchange protein [Gluconobacter oxydans]GAN90071.1 thiol:disulfide interchange protein/alkyl hydroperoxide reductase [Gluconobacter frateurii M-2]